MTKNHKNKSRTMVKIIPARDPNSSILNPAVFSVQISVELSNHFSAELHVQSHNALTLCEVSTDLPNINSLLNSMLNSLSNSLLNSMFELSEELSTEFSVELNVELSVELNV